VLNLQFGSSWWVLWLAFIETTELLVGSGEIWERRERFLYLRTPAQRRHSAYARWKEAVIAINRHHRGHSILFFWDKDKATRD
jgi:hypothetical protein